MSFAEIVYEELKKVPKGKVTTYMKLGEKIGTKAYRAIGTALKNNPYAPDVPCHRVVRSDGGVGGFRGKIGGPEVDKKIEMLKSEGVAVNGRKIEDFKNKIFLS